MRIAIVSDIHGNRTAFDAILADLREASPDLILHGGDLADIGSSPTYIIDQIRELGWRGVMGNTDEALARPESLERFACQSTALPAMWNALRDMMAAAREALGEERLHWLRSLPLIHTEDSLALVHATPDDPWRAPANDPEFSCFMALGKPITAWGHVHRPSIHRLRNRIVANSGSAGLPYDGDPRASYLLVDRAVELVIRRVAYDVDDEVKARSASGIPHSGWVARMLTTATPQLP